MGSYNLKINGTLHVCTIDADGQKTYSPPLPESDGVMESRFRDMCESHAAPGLRTETSFWSGRGSLADQWKHEPKYLEMLCRNARKRGYNPKSTDTYFQSLARPEFRDGDPQAFVSAAEGISKIKKIYEARGIEHSDGIIKTTGREAPSMLEKPKKLANDIVHRLSAEYRKKDPEKYGKMKKNELREVVIQNHAPKD
jgi:hypothetical protein